MAHAVRVTGRGPSTDAGEPFRLDLRQPRWPNPVDPHQIVKGTESLSVTISAALIGPMCFMRSNSSSGAEFTSTWLPTHPADSGGAGVAVGSDVGVGMGTGVAVGSNVGVGMGAGVAVGSNVSVGMGAGVAVGSNVGVAMGADVAVGSKVGVGMGAGVTIGTRLGVGAFVGKSVGTATGATVLKPSRVTVGSGDGLIDGAKVPALWGSVTA